jgi:hypothetical protein
MSSRVETPPSHGLLAEFESPEALVRAVEKLHADGYRRIEGYTPYPVRGLAEALRFRPVSIPAIFLVAALLSGAAGYFMQWYASVVAYPLNIGGRPLHSWPSFIPITFESTILGGVLCGALGMIVLNKLPRYHHPISNVERFRAASSDGFFLCIEATDPKFESGRTTDLLRSLHATEVTEIPYF